MYSVPCVCDQDMDFVDLKGLITYEIFLEANVRMHIRRKVCAERHYLLIKNLFTFWKLSNSISFSTDLAKIIRKMYN